MTTTTTMIFLVIPALLMHVQLDTSSFRNKHKTIIRTGRTCKNSFIRVYRIRYAFEVKQNSKIFLATRSSTCWRFDSCFQFLRKSKIGVKANLQLTLYESVTQLQLFLYINVSKTASKIFATRCFFDHLKYKSLNKITCSTPSANPPKLCAH